MVVKPDAIPTLAAARFQKWAIHLTSYNYELVFRPKTKHSNVDGLSCLPLEESNKHVQDVNTEQLYKEIRKDPKPFKVI